MVVKGTLVEKLAEGKRIYKQLTRSRLSRLTGRKFSPGYFLNADSWPRSRSWKLVSLIETWQCITSLRSIDIINAVEKNNYILSSRIQEQKSMALVCIEIVSWYSVAQSVLLNITPRDVFKRAFAPSSTESLLSQRWIFCQKLRDVRRPSGSLETQRRRLSLY